MIAGFLRRLRRNAAVAVGAGLLALVVFVGAGADLLSPQDPWSMSGPPMLPPLSAGHLFGTDLLGRDVLGSIVHGTRVSLAVGAASTAAAILIGVLVGAVAGYVGGWADDLLMGLTEFFQAIPSFILALLIVALFRPSVGSIVAALAIVSWPPVARVVRGEFLTLRSREFVSAARLLGEGPAWIIGREILPNALSPIIVLASFMVATAILTEAGLSFIGLGDPNAMSWGFMIGSGRSAVRFGWWISLFPGLALVTTVLSLNLIGEGVSDALNPRLRERA